MTFVWRIQGRSYAMIEAWEMVRLSIAFQVEPLPDGEWEFSTKKEHESAIRARGYGGEKKMEWPCNASDLSRRLGFPTKPGELDVFRVRESLAKFGCGKLGTGDKAQWIVTEEIANLVADDLGLSLKAPKGRG